ncbi:MAG: DUF2783 domain-containing protein [Pseudomonadota bacterium]
MILDDTLGQHGDDAYAALIAAHEGLSTEQSHALNARIVLILMNEIGNADRLQALFQAARADLD